MTSGDGGSPGDEPLVLIVDDEPRIVELFDRWLSDRFATRTALDGHGALDVLDESVDVVLLDRRMPGLPGDDVLDEIVERDIGCRVAMVTAVKPDFDIIEMGFDDYLTKPVPGEELVATVERLLTRSTYDEQISEHFALVSKKAALEAERPIEELEASDAYARLDRDIERSREQLDETLAGIEDEELHALYRDLGA